MSDIIPYGELFKTAFNIVRWIFNKPVVKGTVTKRDGQTPVSGIKVYVDDKIEETALDGSFVIEGVGTGQKKIDLEVNDNRVPNVIQIYVKSRGSEVTLKNPILLPVELGGMLGPEIEGYVFTKNNEEVSNATVKFGDLFETETARNGKFIIRVAIGTYNVSIIHNERTYDRVDVVRVLQDTKKLEPIKFDPQTIGEEPSSYEQAASLYIGSPSLTDEVLSLFQKAANSENHPVAQLALYATYDIGDGVNYSKEESDKWLNKVLEDQEKTLKIVTSAAESGDPVAQNCLGILYYEGHTVEQDLSKAAGLFRKAADQGHRDAKNSLAWLYFTGKSPSIAQDFEKAYQYALEAAENGHCDAQNTLGLMYKDGKGVAKDLEKAKKWFQRAADRGYHFAIDNLEELGDSIDKNRPSAPEVRRQFWEELLAFLVSKGHSWADGRNAPKTCWLSSSVGKSGVSVNVGILSGGVRVEIYFSQDSDKSLIGILESHSTEIERLFPEEDVLWQPLEDKSASRVSIFRPYTEKDSSEGKLERPAIFEWISINMERFREIATRFIVNVEPPPIPADIWEALLSGNNPAVMIQQLLEEFEFNTDGRNSPDEQRRTRFRVGWEDATVRDKAYSDSSLAKLTWSNLGYRLGKMFGVRAEDEMNEVFDLFAVQYTEENPPPAPGSFHNQFETILKDYASAKQDKFIGTHPVSLFFDSLSKDLALSDPVAQRLTLQVQYSVGEGNWATIPWISFLDSRETSTTQDGVYCVLLFCADQSGVYMTLGQGITVLQKEQGTAKATQIVGQRAEDIRKLVSELADNGFHLDNNMDLKSSGSTAQGYQASTIAYKFYPAGTMPGNDTLLADLEAVLRAYDLYLSIDVPDPGYGEEGSTPVDDSEELFLSRIKEFPSRSEAELYLDLCKDMVEVAKLNENDPRLAMAIPKQRGQLTVSIGNRYVLRVMMHKPSPTGFCVRSKKREFAVS